MDDVTWIADMIAGGLIQLGICAQRSFQPFFPIRQKRPPQPSLLSSAVKEAVPSKHIYQASQQNLYSRPLSGLVGFYGQHLVQSRHLHLRRVYGEFGEGEITDLPGLPGVFMHLELKPHHFIFNQCQL